MSTLTRLYGSSLALLTDLYELTMAQAAWRAGVAHRRAAFHLLFRHTPFKGGYAVAAGLGPALDYLEAFRFAPDDLSYLASLKGDDGGRLFQPEFLAALGALSLEVEVDAIEEGTPVFAQEPLVRVTGPFLQCMLLETPLLNLINFQTLIATKAARVSDAAGADPVIEFGLRRAQGIDGGLGASRAAFIGGCAGTSNTLAGKLYGIPVRGTHAHSWVMFFDDELESFRTYAKALPNNCIFLVDTYDTLTGVKHAIEVGKELRRTGHRLVGIRLDSGDLAYLSIEARKLLDEAGFPDARILASNELDEHLIQSLKLQGAQIGAWGVGTRLVTGFDEPALGGVYKLGAVQDEAGHWAPRLKVSEQAAKTSVPGRLQVRRYTGPGGHLADVIYDLSLGPGEGLLVDPADATRRTHMPRTSTFADLLQPVFRGGKRTRPDAELAAIRDRARAELARIHPGIRRFAHPHEYPVGLEPRLHQLRHELILRARSQLSERPRG